MKNSRLSNRIMLKFCFQRTEYFFFLQIEAIHRNLCWLQLRRALGEQANLTPYQHVEFSESLVKLYQETLHLSSNMVDTDIRWAHEQWEWDTEKNNFVFSNIYNVFKPVNSSFWISMKVPLEVGIDVLYTQKTKNILGLHKPAPRH